MHDDFNHGVHRVRFNDFVLEIILHFHLAPRRSWTQQCVLEATPPPAPIHRGGRDSTRFDLVI